MSAHSPVDAMSAMSASNSGSVSPRTTTSPPPKAVSFELLFPESPQYRARLPLRVSIFQHDTTDSIVTTVKNFYGLYSGPSVSKGVSFEDEHGNTLIARYENFRHNMVVSVRVIEEVSPLSSTYNGHAYHSTSVGSQGYGSNDAYHQYAPVSRPASRTSRVRSPSPNSGRGRRSDSAGTSTTGGKKGRSRSSKTRGIGDHAESVNGYSSGDGAPGSVSGKSKDHLGNTEISVENIVEGGRRKRAKFESSELPLFAPPQMPAAASNSSVSPARRADHHRHSLPFVQPGQNPFSNPRPLQSPQSYNNGYANTGMYATPAVDERRARGSFSYSNGAVGAGGRMMPTPDPTVGSCMSEEDKDVAIQLMRLGEMSNMSHGRTSASTLDDTFSGKADAASSTGATSDAESGSDDELPPARRQKLDSAGNHKKSFQTTQSHFIGPKESADASDNDADYEDGAEEGSMAAPKLKNPKPKSSSSTQGNARPRSQSSNKPKSTATKQSKPKIKKNPTTVPITPASLPAASRKPSVASNSSNPPPPAFPLAPPLEDEQPDLSTKPRCQRCRKSKKGCDRQRPCGRCRDAGLSADMCISEDEGNGRKGRYGRHMGVPISKQAEPALSTPLLPAAPIAASVPGAATLTANADSETAAPVLATTSSTPSGGGKDKKRKR